MIGMKKTLILSFVFAIVAFFGCAAQHFSDDPSQTARQILDITIDENPESVILSIKGNQTLTYTSDVERNPMGLYLSFPETAADNVLGRFIPPKNEIINSIRVGNFVEDQAALTIVFVALNQDPIYEITSDRSEIQIRFTKKADVSYTIEPGEESAAIHPVKVQNPETRPVQRTPSPASRLKEVTATTNEGLTTISLEADGAIIDYKTFKLINPDRVVFDFYNLKSPDWRQRTIGVQSDLVHRIRYYGHPDKLRLVIDTRNNRLLKYTTKATDTGLIIMVDRAKDSAVSAPIN